MTEKFEADGEQRAKVELHCANQYGDDKLLGEADRRPAAEPAPHRTPDESIQEEQT